MSVRWTQRAFSDFDSFFDSIAADKPIAARRIVGILLEQARQLSEHPYRGRPGRLGQTRELAIPRLPYVLVYTAAPSLTETAPVLTILRVMHGAMRWPPGGGV